MAFGSMKETLRKELQTLKETGLFKEERVILSPQGTDIKVSSGDVVNFCANNYLGLANHPEIVATVKEGLSARGFGMASVRFICGTQDIHKELEQSISHFLKTEDTILYSSCFDANGGLFETLLGADDVVISDELNHASIIDGIRLCKAGRKVYKHNDMLELEAHLRETQNARYRMIATDGAFSMHGDLARLDAIAELTERYDALVMVDDSHATGFFGPTGRGTPEYFGVQDRIDVITSTLGKAMGGASGGFTSGRGEIVAWLRQKSRPYLFSNSVAPPVVYGSMKAFELIDKNPHLIQTLADNTKYFRSEMKQRGFKIKEGIHPIVPIMLGEEIRTVEMARQMNARGIFVVGFSYPVVPKGQARIRVQISATHTKDQLNRAIDTFAEVGKLLDLI
ncbi:MAG TPA: glycine C-acetyltransferase [Acidobacteriota bacterium]|nr:glycine C-acetyltransferase [Acidobacteriota bacterium]